MKRLLCLLALAAIPAAAGDFIEHARSGSGAAFTFDASAWVSAEETRRLPSGVFDSGIGGLTVMEALLTVDAFHNDTLEAGPDGTPDFVRERFVYFGDQANMPSVDYQYSRLPGNPEVEDTKNVPLTPWLIPVNSAKLVSDRLPAVWAELRTER